MQQFRMQPAQPGLARQSANEYEAVETNSYSRLHRILQEWLVKPKTRKGQVYCWCSWIAILAAGCILFWQGLPRFVDHVVKPTINYIQNHFTKVQVAAIALAALTVLPVVFLSSTPVMLLVSAVLGFWWGFFVATIGTAIGMTLPFLIGKRIFKSRLHGWVHGNEKAEAMLLAIQEAGTFKVTLLMRQCIPYTWLNYAAAAPPEMTFPWYFLGSVIGQVPHNAVDVYLGGNVAGLGDLLKGRKVNTATKVTYGLGFTAAFLTALLGYVYARRALRKIQANAQRSADHSQAPHSSASSVAPTEAVRSHPVQRLVGSPALAMNLASPETSRQHMLLHQDEALDYAADSPSSSADSSPTHRRLLQPTPDVAVDVNTQALRRP